MKAYAHVEEIKPNRAKEALKNHYDMAKMSKELATICLEAPLTLSFEDARLTNLYTPEAYEWCRKLNFKKLLGRFEEAEAGKPAEPEVTMVTDFAEAENLFSRLKNQKQIAFELYHEDGLHVSLTDSEQEVFCVSEEGFLTEPISSGQAERNHRGSTALRGFRCEKIISFCPSGLSGTFV